MLGQSLEESSRVAAMLVAQFRGYMGSYLALSGEYARCIMVGTEGKLVATQPPNSGGQTCIRATASPKRRGPRLGII